MNSENIHPFFQGFDFFSFVHRGGAEEATENTLEAFKHASDMGFVFMETDIQGTKDGEVVVFHDHDLSRMAGINKKIEDLTFKEVKQIELIGGGRIPSLDELLSSFPQLRFNIDFKTENSIESGVNIILNHNALNRVCLASFSTSRLNKIRKLAGPNCCSSMGQLEIVYLLFKSRHLPFPKVEGHCAQVPPSQWAIPIVTKKFVDYAHKENKFVHVWTIDKKSEMEGLIELGVDGLMTDKPTTLMEVIRERNLI